MTTAIQTYKRRSKKPLVLVAVIAALAIGSSTFALWSASDMFDGGTITAGDLDLVTTELDGWYDISADRSDATELLAGTETLDPIFGHAIDDISTWRMVPGDTIARVFEADITLEGDNLVAELSLTVADGSTTFEGDGNLTYGFAVYKDGELIGSGTTLTDGVIAVIEAPEAGQGAGASDGLTIKMTDNTESFVLVITATFRASTTDRVDVGATDALGGMTLALNQVRTPGTGLFVTP